MNTTDKRQLTIDSYTKEATNINNFTYLDSTIITFDTNNYYYFLVFTGKKTKPTNFIRTISADLREVAINSIKKIILDKYEKNLSFIESKKAISNTIQKGTILYSDWGYEQTNINFYLVLERKNSKLILQEIGQIRTYERQDDGTYSQKTTYCNAALWISSSEGSPLLDSLKKGKSITIFTDRMPEIDVKIEGDKTFVNRNYTVKDIAL
ncbi:TPA: hypothetical protein JRX32_003549 [Elizabethkingia anophelis]|nr:hypothetical protein [Elizabethkingia anophelis]HAY3549002.1 hypothetical protein [Elizabethkingia anophelis]